MCHLREFFIVHHMREKEDKSVDIITIPKIHSQRIVLDASGQQLPFDQLVSELAWGIKKKADDFSHCFRSLQALGPTGKISKK